MRNHIQICEGKTDRFCFMVSCFDFTYRLVIPQCRNYSETYIVNLNSFTVLNVLANDAVIPSIS